MDQKEVINLLMRWNNIPSDITIEPMYQGKSTCETLKSIRKQIADANEIPYEPVVCTHQGDCMGTCPACESEMRYIENQLNIRKSNGKDIKLDRLASDLVYSPKKHITGKHGTVIVEFVVERDGSISDIEVVQGIDPILDGEAIFIIQKMNKFKPSLNNECRPFRSRFRLPVFFYFD